MERIKGTFASAKLHIILLTSNVEQLKRSNGKEKIIHEVHNWDSFMKTVNDADAEPKTKHVSKSKVNPQHMNS